MKLEDCLYVGDSFEKDIVGAISVGMNAVLVNRNAVSNKLKFNNTHYWTINSFEQLDNVIKEIEGLA